MVDTVRKPSYFTDPTAGAFRDNTSGIITPQALRDFVVSMTGCTIRSVVEYGAVADGTTDNSAAFNTALSENVCVYIPPVSQPFMIKDVLVPSGRTIFGWSVPNYYAGGTIDIQPCSWVRATSTATAAFKTAGNREQTFRGLTIWGNTYQGTGIPIEAGGNIVNILDCNLQNGKYGYGSDSTYTNNTIMFNCQIGGHNTGLRNLVDVTFHGGAIYSCTTGILLQNGAELNNISTRIEWCNTWGAWVESNDNLFNCTFDANGYGGIGFNNCSNNVLNGTMRGNGRLNSSTADQCTHVWAGNVTGLVINVTNRTSVHNSVTVPRYGLYRTGTNTGLIYANSYLAGTTGAVF